MIWEREKGEEERDVKRKFVQMDQEAYPSLPSYLFPLSS